MKKSIILLLLVLALVLMMIPCALAEEDVGPDGNERPEIGKTYSLTFTEEQFPQGNEEQLSAYVEAMFMSGNAEAPALPQDKSLPDPRDILDDVQYKFYQNLKTFIHKVAQGKVTSTKVTLTYSNLSITYNDVPDRWDMDDMFQALFLDCGCETYWFGRYVEWKVESSKITFYFYTSADFAADSTFLKVNSKAIQNAATAVGNVNAIVSACKDMTDVEKLYAYKEAICRLTDYNFDAAYAVDNDMFDGVEGPWNLVWVFDGNPATDVVCEGYAKAFEYLCNKTAFQSSLINCWCVTGPVTFYNGAGGPHMWNMVTMPDGRNYLVDVTNCDDGDEGNNDYFLLFAVSGDPAKGYNLPEGSYYGYDNKTLKGTSKRTRTLATSPYAGAPGDVTITTQPQSLRVVEGQEATFTVAATGTDLSYQWYYVDLKHLGNGPQKIDGATTPTLTRITTGDMDMELYFCLVRGASGQRASEGALLEVVVAPVIITQPVNVTVRPGEYATVSLKATGTHIKYRWYVRSDPEAAWQTAPGTMDLTEDRTGFAPIYSYFTHNNMDQPQLYCVVSNEAGTVSSNIVTVTVLAVPKIENSTWSVEVLPGETATFQVEATGKFLTYRWYVIDTKGVRTLIDGATGDTYSLTATADKDNYTYECYVSNASGEVYRSMQLHLITAAPTITKDPEDVVIRSGNSIMLLVEAEGYGLSYQWYCDDGETEFALENKTTRGYYFTPSKADDGNQYWCVVSNALGSATSARATVTLFKPPVIEVDLQDVSAKPGTTAEFTITATGEGLQYYWKTKAPGASSFTGLNDSYASPVLRLPVTKDMDGYMVQCTVFNDGGRVESRTATLTLEHVPGDPVREHYVAPTYFADGGYDEVVYCTVCKQEVSREHVVLPKLPLPAPTIVTQPKSVTVNSGAKATFSVKAKGVEEKAFPLSYQWFECAPDSDDWQPIEGATKNSYSFVTSKARMNWKFRCAVQNDGGTTLTGEVTLTLKLDTPVVKTQPKDVTVKSGAKAKLSVKASGKNLTYTWFTRATEVDPWAEIAGANKADYTFVASMAQNGSQYYCHIENGDGSVDSAVATLTVTPQPASIKTQPKDAKVKSGATAKFKVGGSGPNLSYQWYVRASVDDEWAEIAGATKADYSFTASMTKNGSQYYCKVWNDDGSADSDPVTLTVTPVPVVIKTHPKSVTVKSESKGKFTVKASGSSLKYQWFTRASEADAWTEIDGATNADYSFTAKLSQNGAQFYCRVWNDDESLNSDCATLTVTPQPPKFSTQPKDAKVKAGAKATFKTKASGKGVTYQWYYRTSEDGEWILLEGETSASLTVTATEENFGLQYSCRAKNADGEVCSNPAFLLRK